MADSVIGQILELQELQRMTVAELQVRWHEVFGEPARSRNKPHLYRRIAWEVQAKAYGGLSARAQERIRELAPDHFPRAVLPRDFQPSTVTSAARVTERRPVRDPKLPSVGTVLTRKHHGREIRVVVHADGFEYDGRRYGSLSEIARTVTGARWNGRLWFGLTERKRKP